MGRVYKLESMSALDGPGLRYVVFLQGCPLRCDFCHNRDAVFPDDGTQYSANELFDKILSAAPYIKKRGGVTISGGEPLFQPDFCAELLTKCRAHALHTAIETSGAGDITPLLALLDLVILDIKADGKNAPQAKTVLDACQGANTDVWLTQVVIPGRNDDAQSAARFCDFAKGYSCVKKLTLLPYHTMGLSKWHGQCPIEGVPAMDRAECAALQKIIDEKRAQS